MQARVAQVGEVYVVHLAGHLDVETAEPFRNACMRYLVDKMVIFNFKELSFVGSSGILPFLETIQDFANVNRVGFKFCSMSIEFRKVFSATPLGEMVVFENEAAAIQSLLNPSATIQACVIGAVRAVPKVAEVADEAMTSRSDGADSSTKTSDKNFGHLSLRHEPEELHSTHLDDEADSDG